MPGLVFQLSVHHSVINTEGLGLISAYTSSLVKVQEYQNSSIFLDLSSNTAFSSYKVHLSHLKIPLIALNLHVFRRCRSWRTIQARMTFLWSYQAGTSARLLWQRLAVVSKHWTHISHIICRITEQEHCHFEPTSWQAVPGCHSSYRSIWQGRQGPKQD